MYARPIFILGRYPVLLRRSYILSGTAMRVAHNSVDLDNDFETACIVSRDYPVVMSKFVIGWALTTF